jgi:hypothetical protein
MVAGLMWLEVVVVAIIKAVNGAKKPQKSVHSRAPVPTSRKMALLSTVSLNDVVANIVRPTAHIIIIIPTELYTEASAIIFYILRKFHLQLASRANYWHAVKLTF